MTSACRDPTDRIFLEVSGGSSGPPSSRGVGGVVTGWSDRIVVAEPGGVRHEVDGVPGIRPGIEQLHSGRI